VAMCGHAAIGTAIMLVQLGMVEARESELVIRFATPAGPIAVHVALDKGKADYAWFENVPAFLCQSDVEIDVAGLGRIAVDIAYGGNYFCLVPEESVGISLDIQNSEQLFSVAACIRQSLNAQFKLSAGPSAESAPINLIQISGRAHHPAAHARNVVVGSRTIDRSPCGTGTCARMAVLYARGQLQLGETFVHESIIGTLFYGHLLRTTRVGAVSAVVPTVGGHAYITGIQQFVIDPDDPLKYGFLT
jgi:proline racemase